MDWLKLLAPTFVGACITGAVGLLVALVGPGTYRGWRIKKLLDLVKDLDGDRFPGQRAVFLDQVERLATQMAAIYKVPHERRLLTASYVLWGALAGSVFTLLNRASSASGVSLLLDYIFALILTIVTVAAMKPANDSFNYVKFHRAEFVRRGIPESYELPPRPRPWWIRK
ncbi:hypothetical protein ACFXPR_18090 [Nocardia tengchongensis]|uniref:Uncharacterized protein n=1 Tax=Nocardia tengchongensis TaxID=2055889 RepID=A0ABX8CKR3_9NOCA|nr:hypothetical protein [Nocardia tengchongensis]QVI19448.1 hypothetical protein KHQ06_24070 [Nocardia tengchongensis]